MPLEGGISEPTNASQRKTTHTSRHHSAGGFQRRRRHHPSPGGIRISAGYRHLDNGAGAGKVPSYEAVSYAWGTPETTPGRIFLQHSLENGHALQGWLPARENLISALRHLRRGAPRTLWIDQLCINQGDEIEKGPQVALIGEVYQLAERVIAWLDPSSEDSPRAMKFVERLGLSKVDVDFQNISALAMAGKALQLRLLLPRSISAKNLQAVVNLSYRKWFERLWVRQEIFLARQDTAIIQCGGVEVPWEIFAHGWAVLYIRYGSEVAKTHYDRGMPLSGFLTQIMRWKY